MKLKAIIDLFTDTQPIHIYVSGNDDFEIAGRLGSIPETLLVTMRDSDVAGIFTDDKEALIIILKGDDGDDKSD